MTVSQSEIKRIFELRSQGHSYRKIEQLTGVPKTKVGEILKNEKTVPLSSDSENKCGESFFCPDCKKNCEETCKFYLQNKRASESLYNFMKDWKERQEKKFDKTQAYREIKQKEVKRRQINFYEDNNEEDYDKEEVDF